MSNVPVEYVPRADTMADIALHYATSGSLRTTATILLGLLVVFSFVFNIILLATILSSRKLRSIQLFILFCNLAILNLFDILSGMFISLLFIANGYWFSNMTLCRFNAAVEQFISMELLMSIMIMAVERAITLFFPHRLIFHSWRTLAFVAVLWIISICLAVPILTNGIPVKPYRFRYICGIDSKAPILYSIVRILVYGGCLFISIVCFGALLSRGNQHRTRSLPLKPHENPEFIKQSRALHEYFSLAKLVLMLMILFILFSGPYIILSFLLEIRNSYEVLKYSSAFEVPQDADTVLNWLRFVYPLLAPLLIYASCAEVWLKVQQLVLCRGPKTTALGRWANDQGGGCGLDESNVITLFATSEGLHLRMPPRQTAQQQTDDVTNGAADTGNHVKRENDEILKNNRSAESTVSTAVGEPRAETLSAVDDDQQKQQQQQQQKSKMYRNERVSTNPISMKQPKRTKKKSNLSSNAQRSNVQPPLQRNQNFWRY